MKKYLLVLSVLFAVSCNNAYQPSADEQMQQKQAIIEKEANAQAGLPAIHNFQEKKLLKQIYELRDNEKLVCYAYLFNHFSGKLVFIGRCMGYGIPYSTQYSNPEKEIYEGGYQRGFGSLPQAEPNGLFMPTSSSATWLMMIDETGAVHPVYIEPEVIVSPFKLNV